MNSHINSRIWIHTQTLLGTLEFICVFFMNHSPWIHTWIDSMNSYANLSRYPQIHGFSWIHAEYHGFWPFLMGEIIFKITSEEYCEEYHEKLSWLYGCFKRILNWMHGRCAQTRSVWQGQHILQLLLQSHLPHYLLVCLAELQCQSNLPPRSHHTLSSDCQSCTNLNFVVVSESSHCRLRLTLTSSSSG